MSRRPHFSTSLALSALLLAGTPDLGAAPPTNDTFAASHALGSAVPATHFTSNLEATLEPGEPDPTGNGGASVWYTWTADTAGWHAASSLGSDYDTILYVFEGPTLGSLQLVSRSDDFSPSEYQSLARFQTTAGTTYHIAVHGYNGETGNLFFDIDALESPPLHVTSVEIDTSPGDLAAADSTTTLHIGVTSPDGFSDGSVGLSTPVGGIPGIAFTRFDASDRIAGDDLAGTYAVTVPLPHYGSPGDWPIDLQLEDSTSDTVRYGHPAAGDIFPPGITTTAVPVINTGSADTTPPTLNLVTLTPTSVDITSAPQTVTLTLELSDPLSGTDSAVIDLLDPFGSFYQRLVLSPDDLVSGDPHDGTFTLEIQVPQFITPGTYTIDDFYPLDVIDRTGNKHSYGHAHTPYPPGSSTSFTVVNNAGTDTAAPALTTATIGPADADVGPAPVTLTATFTATDDLSGITSGTVALELDSGELVSVAFDSEDRTAGTATSGTYTVELPIAAPAVTPGTYPLVIELRDAFGFTSEFGGTFGDPIPPGGNHSVTVTDSGPGPSPYELWIASFPSLTGPAAEPGADPDRDGITNLAELPFGLDPTVNSSPGGPDPNAGNAPVLAYTPTTVSLTYTLVPENLEAYNHPPVTVTPQQSLDLATYSALAPTDLGGNRYSATLGVTPESHFLRLAVSSASPQP